MKIATLRWIALALVIASGATASGCDDEGGPAGAGPEQDTGGQDAGLQDADDPDSAEPEAQPEALADAGLDADPPDADPGRVPGTIFIEPHNLELALEPGERRDVQFSAFLVGEDGEPVALDNAQWQSDEPRAGSVDGFSGLYTTSGIGAEATITATSGERRATTRLRTLIRALVLDEGTEAPDAAAFDNPAVLDPQRIPKVIYPQDGTLFPSNIQGVTIQWEDFGLPLFRVRLTGQFVDVTVLTRSSIWLPQQALWQLLARSSFGRPLEIAVDGAEGGEVFRGAQVARVSFSQDAVFGAIYYWSTTDAGIMRLPVGDLAPERFFTPFSPQGSPCVGCHTLSRDGKRMAFNTAPVGIPIGPFMEILTEDPTVRVVDLDQNINGMQPAFNPDGTRVVTGWSGTLTERDANGRCDDDMAFCVTDADCAQGQCVTGQPIRDVPRLQGYLEAFPDWSPDNRWLVSAGSRLPIGFGVDFEIANAALILRPNFGGEWGPPTILFEPRNDQENNFHPAFSPDGRFIAFNHTGLSLNPEAPSASQISALWLTSPTNRVPIELARANLRDGLANSWPKWAPFTGRHLWLAFSSGRSYGKVQRNVEDVQIWITAIDPVLAASGQDPSFPAFWLPGQNIASANHIPYWAPFDKAPDN